MSAMAANSVWHIPFFELSLRLGIALLLGGMIGLERELNNHPAGLRTHILVCLGSTLIMLLSIYGFSEFVGETNVRIDPARLAAQVISGIGFLGAGTIIRNGLSISGLTTAASLWVCAGIGLSIGAGFYSGAFVATLLVLVCLFFLNKFEKLTLRNNQMISVLVDDLPGILGKIAMKLGEQEIQIKKVKIVEDEQEDQRMKIIYFYIGATNRQILEKGLEEIIKVKGAQKVHSEWQSNGKRTIPVEIERVKGEDIAL